MKLLKRLVFITTTCFAIAMALMPVVATAEFISPDLVLVDNSQLVVISSRRTGRTTKQFVLKANLINYSDKTFENVTAKLVSMPVGVTINGGDTLIFGGLFGPDTYQSMNTITLDMNIRARPDLNQLNWRVEGNEKIEPPPPPPPPPPTNPMPTDEGTFMNIDDGAIKGDFDGDSHKDWIELLTWQQGVSAQISDAIIDGPDRAVVAISQSDVSIAKFIDSATTQMRQALLKGTLFREIEIDVIKRCGGNFYTQHAITLVNGVFSSASDFASSGANRNVENLSINVTGIETIYVPVDNDCNLQTPIYSYEDMTL